MTDFLHDLLDDLREKRLLPVALALVVGLLAVPLVLMKSGGDTEPTSDTPAAAVAGPSGAGAVVSAVDSGPSQGSDLGVFDPKDPFKSGIKVKKGAAGDGTAELVTPQGSAGGGSVAPGGTSGPSKPSYSGQPPKDFIPKGTVMPKKPATTPRLRTVRKDYMYVIDVKFGQTGNESTRKGVKRLGILPNDRNPVVVFLGVTSDAGRAVFLVDSRVSQSGEGACRPSVKSCTFLYLRDAEDRNEQFLTDEQGREYHLTLLDIRRVEVKRSSKKAQAKASARSFGPRGGGARKVRFPVLAPDVHR